jgi:S1-C subfamily serine protease
MQLHQMILLTVVGTVILLLTSCSLESRNLGGPSAIGGTPPKHGMLGVEFEPDSLQIVAVLPGGAAEEAMISVGETITAFDGQQVSNRNELQALLTKTKPDTTVELTLTQNDEARKVQVRLMSFTKWSDLIVKEHKRKCADGKAGRQLSE